jgi:hypothetical protein
MLQKKTRASGKAVKLQIFERAIRRFSDSKFLVEDLRNRWASCRKCKRRKERRKLVVRQSLEEVQLSLHN